MFYFYNIQFCSSTTTCSWDLKQENDTFVRDMIQGVIFGNTILLSKNLSIKFTIFIFIFCFSLCVLALDYVIGLSLIFSISPRLDSSFFINHNLYIIYIYIFICRYTLQCKTIRYRGLRALLSWFFYLQIVTNKSLRKFSILVGGFFYLHWP